MDSSRTEIAKEFRFLRVYKDGHVEKLVKSTTTVPPSIDPITGVRTKDVIISPEPSISARIFLPRSTDLTRTLPLLFHIHGGGFCFESAFSEQTYNHLKALVSEASVVAVSVEYRLAPEHPIPACYDDSWATLNWVASHADRLGPEPWLNDYVDFRRVFLIGDSAGANIAHTLSVWVGTHGLPNVQVVGAILVHPFFGGTDDDKMWLYMCPTNGGLEDPRLKPSLKELAKVGCERVVVFVAELDHLRDRGIWYSEELRKSGWNGIVDVVETKGEEHCYHLIDTNPDKRVALRKIIISFINQD